MKTNSLLAVDLEPLKEARDHISCIMSDINTLLDFQAVLTKDGYQTLLDKLSDASGHIYDFVADNGLNKEWQEVNKQ